MCEVEREKERLNSIKVGRAAINMAKWAAHVRAAADPDGGVLLWLMTVTMTTHATGYAIHLDTATGAYGLPKGLVAPRISLDQALISKLF